MKEKNNRISSEKVYREIIKKYPKYPYYIVRKMVNDELERREASLLDESLVDWNVDNLFCRRIDNDLDVIFGKRTNKEIAMSSCIRINTKFDTNFYENLEEKDVKKDSFFLKIQRLESNVNQTFKERYPWVSDEDSLYFADRFLYHGIRFGDKLEKLESIFKLGGIIAGKYLDNYYLGDYENCNEGEYVSLLEKDDDFKLEYDTFVKPNISFVVSPNCGAVKTIYLPYDEYRRLREEFPNTKNRYSYARGEYQVLERVPMDMVRAIGVPYHYLKIIGDMELGEYYLEEVTRLMNLYGIDLPVVDTSYYNKELVKGKRLVK